MSGKLVFRELRQTKEKSKRLEKIIFFNSIHATYLFYTLWKQKTRGFLKFLRGIERNQ